MKLHTSCAALAALSLMAGSALAQEAAAPAPPPAAEQVAPAVPAAPAAPAAPIEAPAAPATEAPAAAEVKKADTAAAEATLGTPAAGKGQVVFYRQSKFTGAAIGFKVREGETELGKLGNGNFFFIDVAPGPHEYVVHSEVKDILPLEVEAGEVYYVQGSLSMGLMVGRPNLSPSDKVKFETAGKMKPSKLKS